LKLIEVNDTNYSLFVEALRSPVAKGFDCETTGKTFKDLPFLLTIATGGKVFYIDIRNGMPMLPPDLGGVWYSHNAKFDVNMLRKIGVVIRAEVKCTMVAERLLCNDLLPKDYSLAATAKRYGMEKDSRVDEYIKAHGLYAQRHGIRQPCFDKVPRELMKEYATKDAYLHLQIGLLQNERFKQTIQ